MGSLLDPNIQYIKKHELEQFKDYVKVMIKEIQTMVFENQTIQRSQALEFITFKTLTDKVQHLPSFVN